MKAESRNPEVLEQSFDIERTSKTCSLDLTLGIPEGGESHLTTTDKTDCRVTGKEEVDSIKQPNGVVFEQKSAVVDLTPERSHKSSGTAPTSRDLNIFAYEPHELCNTNFVDLVKSPISQERSPELESRDIIISLPSQSAGINVPCQSPESILSSLAWTNKAPSIIMKRRSPATRQTGNGNDNEGSLTRENSDKSFKC